VNPNVQFAHAFSQSQAGGHEAQFYSNRSGKNDPMQESSKLIVFVIGGVSHQEISAINAFERN